MSLQPRDEAREELIETWNPWLDQFTELYHTVFEPRGMRFGEALLCYEINRMFNKFNEVLDAINGIPRHPDDLSEPDEWQPF